MRTSRRFEGKVALVTGAARGQGRAISIALAQEGANVIAVDICRQVDSVPYPMARPEDLAETVRDVEAAGARVVAREVDVRNAEALKDAVEKGVSEFGRLDVVSANAGVFGGGRLEDLEEQTWRDLIDINLTGVWLTAKVAIPHLRAAGGGSIVITSSSAGLMASENIGHYVSAKHGLVGLMRVLALELGKDSVRVNTVHPTSVNTEMLHNELTYSLFAPDLPQAQRTRAELIPRLRAIQALPTPWVEPSDVANAVLWLASDEARFVTGAAFPVDAGRLIR
jgi:(+)-trans-carveol dehydrogenase